MFDGASDPAIAKCNDNDECRDLSEADERVMCRYYDEGSRCFNHAPGQGCTPFFTTPLLPGFASSNSSTAPNVQLADFDQWESSPGVAKNAEIEFQIRLPVNDNSASTGL